MTPVPATATRLARLLADADRDRDVLEARATDIERLAAPKRGPLPDRDQVLVLAVHLHGWYFFRNAYVLDLDPKRVREAADVHRQVHAKCVAGVDRLCEHLRGVLAELSKA